MSQYLTMGESALQGLGNSAGATGSSALMALKSLFGRGRSAPGGFTAPGTMGTPTATDMGPLLASMGLRPSDIAGVSTEQGRSSSDPGVDPYGKVSAGLNNLSGVLGRMDTGGPAEIRASGGAGSFSPSKGVTEIKPMVAPQRSGIESVGAFLMSPQGQQIMRFLNESGGMA